MESGQWEGGGRPEAGAEQSPWLSVMEGLCLGGEVSGGWPEQLGGWRCPQNYVLGHQIWGAHRCLRDGGPR